MNMERVMNNKYIIILNSYEYNCRIGNYTMQDRLSYNSSTFRNTAAFINKA